MFNIELLKDLCELSSPSGFEDDVKEYVKLWAEIHAKDAIFEDDSYGNMYFTKGQAEFFPTFVAHLDDVHDMVENKKVFVKHNYMFAMDIDQMEQVGTSGDDRVGVLLALTMLEYLDNVKVALFVEEETGCTGSSQCDISFFDDSAYVIQSDRRGCEDFLCTASGTKLNSKHFQKTLKPLLNKYNLKIAHNGGLTDVVELRDSGVPVCMANVASGYFRPHTDTEVISVTHVQSMVDFYFEMVNLLGDKKWELKTSKKTYSRSSFSQWKNDWDWDNEYEWINGKYVKKQKTKLVEDHTHDIATGYCRDCWGMLDHPNSMYCDTCVEYYKERYDYDPNQY